jgi:hypothetical protein
MSMNPALSPSTLPTPNRSPIVLVLELVLVLGLFFTGKSDVSCGNKVGPQWGKEEKKPSTSTIGEREGVGEGRGRERNIFF